MSVELAFRSSKKDGLGWVISFWVVVRISFLPTGFKTLIHRSFLDRRASPPEVQQGLLRTPASIFPKQRCSNLWDFPFPLWLLEPSASIVRVIHHGRGSRLSESAEARCTQSQKMHVHMLRHHHRQFSGMCCSCSRCYRHATNVVTYGLDYALVGGL